MLGKLKPVEPLIAADSAPTIAIKLEREISKERGKLPARD